MRRDVTMFRMNVGGRKKIVSAGRLLVGSRIEDNPIEPEDRKLTVINHEAVGVTVILEVKPHDIGTLIEDLIQTVANSGAIPIKELLMHIVRPMPYAVIAEMVNAIADKAARHAIKNAINAEEP